MAEALPPSFEGQQSSIPITEDVIPKATTVRKGSVIAEYVLKDGLLIYHVYKADRKALFDEIVVELEKYPIGSPTASKFIEESNARFEAAPWWPDTESLLSQMMREHFRTDQVTIDYYREVDSWSVVMPEPPIPGARASGHLESVVSKLALKFGG